MKNLSKRFGCLIFIFASLLIKGVDLEACGDSTLNNKYVIEKDEFGRLIVLWPESSLERPLLISIDEGPSMKISLPGQACFSPKLHVTAGGDIIVLYAVIEKNSSRFSLYTAALPFGGKWSKPVCLAEDEQIIAHSQKIIVTNDNEINVFWEAVTESPSSTNPEMIVQNKELRFVRGSLDSFNGSPKTLAIIR